ncbi:MAG: toxin-antitoxin system YwqK family antitoxin [Ignavibacteriaceae bacterium]
MSNYKFSVEIDSIMQIIINQLNEDPLHYSKSISDRVKDEQIEIDLIPTYLWALGVTKNPNNIDLILEFAKKDTTQAGLINSTFALSQFQDERCGNFILDLVKNDTVNQRYYFFNLLSTMQFEPAIPYLDEFLEKGFENAYWQIYFVFGKMGMKAVPHLISNLNNPNDNIRQSSVLLLGNWLIADTAIDPLKELYIKERNISIKLSILSALERLAADFNDLEKYFGDLVGTEQEESLKKYAQEVIDLIPEYKRAYSDFKEKQEINPNAFNEEYDLLFNSFGKEGDFENLGSYSTIGKEQELIKLREKVLLRNSDECFYDFEKINKIIYYNRIKDSSELYSSIQELSKLQISYWEGYQITRYDNGNLYSIGLMSDSLMNGQWVYFFRNGLVKAVGKFINGNGKNIAKLSTIPQDGRDSLWIFYDENGLKINEYYYRNEKLDGTIKEWYSDGQKKGQWSYVQGKKNGKQFMWYENGHKMYEGNFINGVLDGEQKAWLENGDVKNYAKFNNGVLIEEQPELIEERIE